MHISINCIQHRSGPDVKPMRIPADKIFERLYQTGIHTYESLNQQYCTKETVWDGVLDAAVAQICKLGLLSIINPCRNPQKLMPVLSILPLHSGGRVRR